MVWEGEGREAFPYPDSLCKGNLFGMGKGERRYPILGGGQEVRASKPILARGIVFFSGNSWGGFLSEQFEGSHVLQDLGSIGF